MAATTTKDNCKEDFTKIGTTMEEADEKIGYISSKIQSLKERIKETSFNPTIERLLPLLELSEDAERKETEVLSHCIIEHSKLLADVNELEEMLHGGIVTEELDDIIDYCLRAYTERLFSLKKELAPKLREVFSLKRQLDDVPIPAELIQYDLRFSELSSNIQQKLRQTRKFYETYNALLEIKELMLKETSLLNSISSQFQDAMTSPVGRTKLINSMEGILQGIQQKLEKNQQLLQSEQRACEGIRKKYTKSLTEQRQVYSLLKDFEVYIYPQQSENFQAAFISKNVQEMIDYWAKHQFPYDDCGAHVVQS